MVATHDKVKNESRTLRMINDFVKKLELTDVHIQYDARSGSASITGLKDDIRCTMTLKPNADSKISSELKHAKTIGREAAIDQVKELYRQGYRQVDIAHMLNIAQSTVSTYLKK